MTPDVLRSYKPLPNGQPPAPLFEPVDRLLTIKEAAELSRVDETFIRKAARQRQLRLVILRAKNASHSFFKINNSLSIVPYPAWNAPVACFRKPCFR